MNKCIDYDKESQDRFWWLNKTGGTAHDNMTVLDVFAKEALAALVGKLPLTFSDETSDPEVVDDFYAVMARSAYNYATAMMNERTKQESNDV